MIIDNNIINMYVDTYGENAGLILLKVLAHPDSGGEGYKVQKNQLLMPMAGKLIKQAK